MTIELPCNVNDTVYCIENGGVVTRKVICFMIGQIQPTATLYQQKAKEKTFDASFDMFGKTVFLSRTEAQRSLPIPTA